MLIKMENKKPVIINTKIRVDKNPIGIPAGTFIDMRIEIIDEYASVRTSYAKFTKDLVRAANPGEIARYNERLQKTITKYPGMSQADIFKKISAELAKLPKGA